MEPATFASDGPTLSGVSHLPAGRGPGERRPGFFVLHGFGSNTDSESVIVAARMLAQWGSVALRFDMRDCGRARARPGL